MLKVSVYRVGAQLAAASGMAAAGALAAGCADVESDSPPQENVHEVASPFFGGDVLFDVSGWPGVGQSIEFVITAATTDEFLRVGQKLKFDLPAMTLWDWAHPGGPAPSVDDLKKLQATITIVALDEGKPFATLAVAVESFTGTDPFSLRAVTGVAVIPHKTDAVRFSMKITDTVAGTTTELDQSQFAEQPVFGGALPSKSLLFDSAPGFRQRVIEGDDPVAGSFVVLGYTDWRADTLVDASAIDRVIGTYQSSGRFGTVTVPLYGSVVHEVSYAVQYNDGSGFQPEAPLAPNTDSRFLGVGRTCYEAKLNIPGKATHMSLYVHVKTFVLADYPGGLDGLVKYYADGEKVLKAEKYDNPGGQAFTNYEYSVQN